MGLNKGVLLFALFFSLDAAAINTIKIFDRFLPVDDGTSLIPVFNDNGISVLKAYNHNGEGVFTISKIRNACDGTNDYIYQHKHLVGEKIVYENKFSFEEPRGTVYMYFWTDCNASIMFFDNTKLMEKWRPMLQDSSLSRIPRIDRK